MKVQLSSGQGPAECELAVGKLLRALKKEFSSIEVLESSRGAKADCYRSVLISCEENLSFLEGTVKWICESPYRPGHKRKNWFVDVSVCGGDGEAEPPEQWEFDERLVRFETFRSGGKGGQHVNKVETGVRAVYVPTGLAVVSTQARSQQLNKRLALDRLCALLASQVEAGEAVLRAYRRMEHTRLERGNAVRIYEGMEFRLMSAAN